MTTMTFIGATTNSARAAPAAPSPIARGKFDPGPAYWAKQTRVHKVLDAIEAVNHRSAGDSGFTDFIVDAKKLHLTVLWRGTPPAAATKATSADRGVKVTFKRARYSMRDLLAARDKVVADAKATTKRNTAARSPIVVSVGASADGNGLDVAVRPPGRVAKLPEATVAEISGRLAASTGGVPARLSISEGRGRPFSRDDQPEYAGARWGDVQGSPGRGKCTTGPTVWAWGSWSYSLTARHCVTANNSVATRHSTGGVFASTQQHDGDSDTMLLMPWGNLPSGFFTRRIWVGGPHENRWYGNAAGVFRNARGDRICSSGAFSGQICGIVILSPYVATMEITGQWVTDLMEVQSEGLRHPIAGPGDSGGTVYHYDGNAAGNLYVSGIVNGGKWIGQYSDYCIGEQGRACGNYGWFANINPYFERNPAFSLRTW